ncbi:MAG TPA: WecB/TagA/CpsF family glycosyltransferase [Alphaproteobacteria bacterium]|nr:WecB/TagA/CpsF family glycosyltransferase [Alphaproteobacteria bacterium]
MGKSEFDASATGSAADWAKPDVKGKVVSLSSLLSRVTPGVKFLGLTFDPLGIAEAARLVIERSERALPFVYVVTPNVDHRVRLEREPALFPLYAGAWMTLCDSRIIELMARIDGAPLRASPGADLVEHLFTTVIRPDDVLNVVGTTADVIETLRARYGLRNLRWHECPQDMRLTPDAMAAAAQFVAQNPAPITFICVGSPQQELVARAIVEQGEAKGVGLCCGASLEFLTGKVPRAPKWMRNLALEWLHRLATNPFRFSRRYLIDGPTIFPIWLEARRKRRASDDDDRGSQARTGSVAVPVHPAA